MRHREGIIAFVGLSSFLLCGATAPNGCSTPPHDPNRVVDGTIIAVGAGIAVGTIVIIAANKSRHTIKGCVTVGPAGVQVHNEDDRKLYGLTGLTANVKVGDIVKVHGIKEKHQKDSAGDEEFAVQKINRDYGPCKVGSVTPANTTSTTTP